MKNDDRTLDERLAQNLRTVRRARGLSQRFLAERLGIGREAIADMELGNAPIPAITLFEIAGILDADMRWFFVDTATKLGAANPANITPALELRIMQTKTEEAEIRDLWRFMRFAEIAGKKFDPGTARAPN